MPRLHHSIRAALPVWGVLLIILGVGIGVVSFVPSGSCNVGATVTLSAVQFVVGSYYSVNGVSATTTGYSSLLNWGALGFTTGLTANDVLAVTIAGHTAVKGEDQLLPTLSIGGHSATDTLTVGYVPQGQQTVVAVLTVNGQMQGSATTSVNVSCFSW